MGGAGCRRRGVRRATTASASSPRRRSSSTGTADVVVDPRNADLLAEHIPDARLELFAGAGHLFFWEQPERFVASVTSFLEDRPW